MITQAPKTQTKTKTKTLEHKHFILVGEIDTPKNTKMVSDTLCLLVALVDMKILHPGIAIRCEEPGNVGNTGFVILTTSHIAWHDWDLEGDRSKLQLDIYSCAAFEAVPVINFMKYHYNMDNYYWKLFDRSYKVERAERQGSHHFG